MHQSLNPSHANSNKLFSHANNITQSQKIIALHKAPYILKNNNMLFHANSTLNVDGKEAKVVEVTAVEEEGLWVCNENKAGPVK